MEVRIGFTIKMNKNLEEKIDRKIPHKSRIFFLEKNAEIRYHGHCFISYRNRNYGHISTNRLFDLVEKGYHSVKKILDKKKLNLENDIMFMFDGKNKKIPAKYLKNCVANVGRILYSKYRLMGVYQGEKFFSAALIPKTLSLNDYMKNLQNRSQ